MSPSRSKLKECGARASGATADHGRRSGVRTREESIMQRVCLVGRGRGANSLNMKRKESFSLYITLANIKFSSFMEIYTLIPEVV